MSIGKYIKEIGRGKEGARALNRVEAQDLFGQVLDGQTTDLEVGAFCLAMRITGETAQEMLGFLDATHARIPPIRSVLAARPSVVIPSYNGARKLPVLTPLLALLIAREGFPVLMHGTPTETGRVFTSEVLLALGIPIETTLPTLRNGCVAFVPTELLCPGLKRLLDVRQFVKLRNSAHSLVKLLSPCEGPSLCITSYTHPEYAVSMAQVLGLMHANAILLRGTEGEPVADARRSPPMQAFLKGQALPPVAAQSGVLTSLPDIPKSPEAQATADYTQAVLQGRIPIPAPIQAQLRVALEVLEAL
jgi:anthranilate phosphoribosyltransferase